MPRYIQDNTTAELVGRLAKLRGLTKQDAVKLAVEAELTRTAEQVSVKEKLLKFWAENQLPPKTGKRADRHSSMTYPAGFDDLR